MQKNLAAMAGFAIMCAGIEGSVKPNKARLGPATVCARNECNKEIPPGKPRHCRSCRETHGSFKP